MLSNSKKTPVNNAAESRRGKAHAASANTEHFNQGGRSERACSDFISLIMKWDICALHSKIRRHGLVKYWLRQDFSLQSVKKWLAGTVHCLRGSEPFSAMALASLLFSTCESKRWPWSEEVDFGSFVRDETAQGCKGLARRTYATAWALTKWHGWWRLWITNYKIESNNRPSVFMKLWKCSVSACSNVHGSSEHKSLSGDKVCIMYFDINRWTRGMKWAASLSWIAFISLTIATIPNTCSVSLRLGLSFFLLKAISIIWHFSYRMGENEHR